MRNDPKDSLEKSLIEMNDIRAGKKKGKSWGQLKSELKVTRIKEK